MQPSNTEVQWAPPPHCTHVETLNYPPSGEAIAGLSRSALLIHGLTGSPREMEPVAHMLSTLGYHSRAPLLPGHCTNLNDLSRATSDDWKQEVHRHLIDLAKTASSGRVLVAGLSLGAILALWTLEDAPALVERLVLLSPALRLRSRRTERLHLGLKHLPAPLLPQLGSIRKSRRKKGYLQTPHNAYPRHSIAAVEQMLRLRDDIINNPPATPNDRRLAIYLAVDPEDHLIDAMWVIAWFKRFYPSALAISLPGGQHELTLGHKSSELLQFLSQTLDHQ